MLGHTLSIRELADVRHVGWCQQQKEIENLRAEFSVPYSRSRKNRHRNFRRFWRAIRSTELCTDLSIEEREHNLEALRCELRSFQRGKQFRSSAVHRPDQFPDEPILDAKTYERFEVRIKHVVRELSARAEGASTTTHSIAVTLLFNMPVRRVLGRRKRVTTGRCIINRLCKHCMILSVVIQFLLKS